MACTAGGVGPTIMETSYLLAGTPVIAYADGKQVQAKPVSQPLTVDFGKGLGRKTVWLYNLPEVESAFKYMKVPSVSARFGTDPGRPLCPVISPACNPGCWQRVQVHVVSVAVVPAANIRVRMGVGRGLRGGRGVGGFRG